MVGPSSSSRSARPRGLERVLHHIVGNLLAHISADVERVAEMDPAPNPHIALLSDSSLMLPKSRFFVGSRRSLAVTGTLCADGTTNSSSRADTPATIAACDRYSG